MTAIESLRVRWVSLRIGCGRALSWWWSTVQAALPLDQVQSVSLEADGSPSRVEMESKSQQDGELVLVIPERAMFRRTVTLPIGARRHLREILRNDLDRLSPLRPDLVYLSFQVIASRRKGRQLDVELRLVKREWLDKVLADCRRTGLDPTGLRYHDGTPAQRGVLPRLRPLPLGKRVMRVMIMILLLVLPLQLVAATWLEMERKQTELDTLLAEVSRARVQAQAVERARTEAARIREGFDRLARERQAGRPSEILGQLSEAIPPDSWIFSLSLEGADVRLSGFSQSASSLLAAIEEAPAFMNAQFRSPVMRIGQDGMERFELSLQVERVR